MLLPGESVTDGCVFNVCSTYALLLHLPVLCQGTDFMLQLADWLRDWAADKVTSDSRFKHCSFIISDASEPGEGEHKVNMTLPWG